MIRKPLSAFILLCLFAFSAIAQETAPDAMPASGAKTGSLVLVAGATGRTGHYITEHLKKQGYAVRAMSRRDPADASANYGADYEWVQADVRDMESLKLALQDVEFVICAIGSTQSFGDNSPEFVDYGGVKNLVDASIDAGVIHFTLISSMGVTHPHHFLNRVRGNVLLWKYLGEEHLRRSGLAYSIIRPGGLSNFPGGISAIDLQQGDDENSQGLITREDVAIVAVESLHNDGAVNKTFEIVNGDIDPDDNWRERLNDLATDEVSETGDSSLEEGPEAPPQLRAPETVE